MRNNGRMQGCSVVSLIVAMCVVLTCGFLSIGHQEAVAGVVPTIPRSKSSDRGMGSAIHTKQLYLSTSSSKRRTSERTVARDVGSAIHRQQLYLSKSWNRASPMDVVGSWTYHTRKDGGAGKKEGSKGRQARQMPFIVMPIASIDPLRVEQRC